VSHSRVPLAFDWEVNGKELEKPTEDSGTKKKHWSVYSGAHDKDSAECPIKKEHKQLVLFKTPH